MAEPFFFMKYGEVIGKASNIEELQSEIRRLSVENPEAVNYHIREGHIAQWVNYVGRKDIGNKLNGTTTIDEILVILEKPERKTVKSPGKSPGRKSPVKGKPGRSGKK